MLSGVNTVSLDAKGRLAVPTKFRTELKDSCHSKMIVTVALDEKCMGEPGCLWLYPVNEWEKVELTISKLSSLNPSAVKLRRFLIGNASECEIDGQGRLLISERLRKFAKLEKRVVLVGLLNKFEIWNESVWDEKEQEWLNGNETEGLEELGSISF